MAPRSEYYVTDCVNFEFKPRLGTWASYDAWSQPKLQMGEDNSSHGRRRQRRRRVRFGNSHSVDVEVKEYMHVSEYTEEEKLACWYSRPQFQEMRHHNATTMDKMANNLPLDPFQECAYGLETRVGQINFICQQQMRLAFLAVIDEQDDQLRFDGVLNDEMIASRYMTHTWEASERAVCIGRAQSSLRDS